MRIIILTFLLVCLSSSSVFANIFIGTGVAYTDDPLVEVSTKACKYTSVGFGLLDNHKYVNLQLTKKFESFDLNFGGAYFTSTPEELTGNLQFQLGFSIELNPSIDLRYIHFSNGEAIFNHGRLPNAGRDFVGIQFSF